MNVFQKTGLAARSLRNSQQRAKGIEPRPGVYAGVKRWARYLKRTVPFENSGGTTFLPNGGAVERAAA